MLYDLLIRQNLTQWLYRPRVWQISHKVRVCLVWGSRQPCNNRGFPHTDYRHRSWWLFRFMMRFCLLFIFHARPHWREITRFSRFEGGYHCCRTIIFYKLLFSRLLGRLGGKPITSGRVWSGFRLQRICLFYSRLVILVKSFFSSFIFYRTRVRSLFTLVTNWMTY